MKGSYDGENAAFEALNDLSRIVYCLSNSNLNYINDVNRRAFSVNSTVQVIDQRLKVIDQRLSAVEGASRATRGRAANEDLGKAIGVQLNGKVSRLEGQIDDLRLSLVDLQRRLSKLELADE